VGQERHSARPGTDTESGGHPLPESQRHRPPVHDSAAPRLLSAQAAAKYPRCSVHVLRDWVLRSHLPVVRVPDCRRWWFDRRDLNDRRDS
jgi:hypothetical protein